jgi:hypothetical protein
MLLEFLAQNIPHTKALMLFDLGKLIEQKILGNFNIYDKEIIQYVIANSRSLIKLVNDQKSFGFSEIQLVLLGDNIVVIRRLDQNKVLVLLLSHLITQESEVLQYNFVN